MAKRTARHKTNPISNIAQPVTVRQRLRTCHSSWTGDNLAKTDSSPL